MYQQTVAARILPTCLPVNNRRSPAPCALVRGVHEPLGADAADGGIAVARDALNPSRDKHIALTSTDCVERHPGRL
jgi:hypothetical protein